MKTIDISDDLCESQLVYSSLYSLAHVLLQFNVSSLVYSIEPIRVHIDTKEKYI